MFVRLFFPHSEVFFDKSAKSSSLRKICHIVLSAKINPREAFLEVFFQDGFSYKMNDSAF